jgi:hypothetical protein
MFAGTIAWLIAIQGPKYIVETTVEIIMAGIR